MVQSKAYDSVTGDDVTNNSTSLKMVWWLQLLKLASRSHLAMQKHSNHWHNQIRLGRYYKFDIPATAEADVPGGSDIENTAAQVVNYNPVSKTVETKQPTENVNNVPVEVEQLH